MCSWYGPLGTDTITLPFSALSTVGTEVETKTLQAGEAIDVNESGALTISFGNPAAAQVTVDGTALTLPPSTGDSLRVALVPAT